MALELAPVAEELRRWSTDVSGLCEGEGLGRELAELISEAELQGLARGVGESAPEGE